MKHLKKLTVLVLGLSIHVLAFADWKVETHLDAMSDETRKKAIIKNERGHTFSVYRIGVDGPAWGNFALSDESLDIIDGSKPPMYRVDKNPPHDLADDVKLQELLARLGGGRIYYSWEPRWVNFHMWHGKSEEGLAPDLLELMDGNTVLFRYHLATGGYKDTSFTLQGASPAISEAIGIKR